MILKEIAEKLVPNPTGYSPPEVAQWVNCDIRSFDYSVLGQYVPFPWNWTMLIPDFK
jgi:hypothetical protein